MKVAIIGAGVGGLTAAVALARKGIEVEIYEQASALGPVGASLQLGPNALRLMAELELLEPLRTVGMVPDAVEFVRWEDGSLLLHTDLGSAMEDHFGAPQLDLFRPDLHRILLERCPPGAVHLGARVQRVEQSDSGVVLTLADGTRAAADLAVAADGIRSTIRQQLLGADHPEFAGTVVYRGLAERAAVVEHHPRTVDMYWIGPERHGVCYWISSGRLLAVNCSVRDAEFSKESWTLEASVSEVLRDFEGWDDGLLARIRGCRWVLRGAVFVRRPIDQWSYGLVTLLGDAAHAMAPFQAQGAAQAVEDAFVLGECLGSERDDPLAALARYEQLRTARAEELQASSSGAADAFYLPDGEQQQARDEGYSTLLERLPWGPRQPIWEHDVREALAG
jgi:salicylate hydroxylase